MIHLPTKTIVEAKKYPSIKYDCKGILFESYEDYCINNDVVPCDSTCKQYMIDAYNPSEYWMLGANEFSNIQRFILEMLNDSLTSKKLYDLLKKTFGDEIIDTDLVNRQYDKKTQFSIICKDINDIIYTDEFSSIMNFANYFVVSLVNHTILLHPWKPQDMTDAIYDKYNGIVYHLTTKENWKKIQKYGLSAKGRGLHKVHLKDKEKEKEINDKLTNTFRPRQTYVLTANDINSKEFETQCKMLWNQIKKSKDFYAGWRCLDRRHQSQMKSSLEDVVMLKIDLKKYKNKIKVYQDPACRGYDAYFLSEYVPSFAISEIRYE